PFVTQTLPPAAATETFVPPPWAPDARTAARQKVVTDTARPLTCTPYTSRPAVRVRAKQRAVRQTQSQRGPHGRNGGGARGALPAPLRAARPRRGRHRRRRRARARRRAVGLRDRGTDAALVPGRRPARGLAVADRRQRGVPRPPRTAEPRARRRQ